MKKLIFGFSILIISSCVNQKPGNSTNQNGHSNQLDTLISGKKLIIKDTTQYSPFFVHELIALSKVHESILLMDDSLIVTAFANTRPDTLVLKPFTTRDVIPTNLELNKEIRFSTKLPENAFSLILKRTNFTNIEYQLIKDVKTIKSGTAILNASFFFGAETQDDESGHIMYLNQYNDNKESVSYLKVEIKDAQRATFTYCVDEKTGKYETLPMFFRE